MPIVRPALALSVLLLAAGPGAAQEARNDPPADSPLRALALSEALADLGRADKDPLKLIVAARLRKSSPLQPLARAPAQAGEKAGADADPCAVETLLAEAVAAGKQAPSILALAADVRASAAKGRSGFKGYSVATVKGAGADWYRGQKFEGRQYAEVAATALAGGGADLYVYDDKGNLVCRDLRQPQRAYCGWTPSTTGDFDIRIENRTAAPLKYRLTTN